MAFLMNGYFQDGLKAVVYLIPVLYLFVKREALGLKFFWLFFFGLSLLFFGHLLDFLDEFESLREMFVAERYQNLQDFFEDMVGFTLGFAVFILAIYLEFKSKIKK